MMKRNEKRPAGRAKIQEPESRSASARGRHVARRRYPTTPVIVALVVLAVTSALTITGAVLLGFSEDAYVLSEFAVESDR